MSYSKSYRRSFGIFIGLLNASFGTEWKVSDALKDEGIRLRFEATVGSLFDCEAPKGFGNGSGSTKRRSLAGLNIPRLDGIVLETIRLFPNGVSRQGVADKSGRRLSSVCGACRRLLDAGRISVVGEVVDSSSGKHVELLAASPSGIFDK